MGKTSRAYGKIMNSPENIFKRFLYHLIRLPLAIITYLIAQTGTKSVPSFNNELINAGFEIISEQSDW